MKRILVTGATGFIGQHLFNLLNEKNELVTLVRSPKHIQPKRVGNTILLAELADQLDWEQALQGIDIIIHLAGLAHNKALSIDDIYEVNEKATICLALAAKQAGVKKFVFMSSINVLGQETKQERFNEFMQVNPQTDSAKAKFKAEKGLESICQLGGMSYLIIRSPMVYGNCLHGNFALLKKLIIKFPFLPFGLCNNKRSFIYVENLTDFIQCVINKNIENKTFLISDDCDLSTRDFVKMIADTHNKTIWQIPLPKLAFILLGKRSMIPQLFSALEVDISHAKNTLHWKPKFTPFEALKKISKS